MNSKPVSEQIKETRIRLCLDCGKCTTFCPVAACNPEFNPRLMIQRTLNRSSVDPSDELIWSCLNCQTCQQYCNYNVKFPDFMVAVRQEAVKSGIQVQCSHGASLQTAMHLMAESKAAPRRLEWLPDDIRITKNSSTRFFVGCAPYFDIFFQDLEVHTLEGVTGALRLLNQAGIEFDMLENERCCGRDLLLQGDRDGFLKLAEANQSEFKNQGVKRLITYCPECYVCLKKEYPAALGNSSMTVVNLVELLAPLVKEKKLNLDPLSGTVTYHDPCTLGRASGLYDEPRLLLQSKKGLNLVEMENNRERALCCGANPWAYCNTVNRQIQGQRLAQAEATQAEVLVTACPKCQIHLKCAQKSHDCRPSQIPIQDLAHLLTSKSA
jgi:heterodisulfide reductase subunit D